MCRAEKVIEITGPPSTVTQRSLYGHNAVSLSSVDVLHRAGGMTFDGAPIRHVPVSARTDTGPLGGVIVIHLTLPCWCVAAWLTFVAFAQSSPIASDEQTFDFLVRLATGVER